ncbi:MAG: DUF2461 domain-containing protein [Acidobacteriota bacterium]|nr:DUF2461 domain-containing protein [Acidobacteriota bacterium]
MPAHFTEESIKFLRGLKRNNDRTWFEARKPVFERGLKVPMLAVIAAVNDAMVDFAPENVRPPQKVMMRIYRDIRFSSDKSPYKTQVAAWWAREGLEKTSGGGYYFHLSATELTIAAGVYMPQAEQLLAIRRHLLEHHAELRALLAGKKLRAKLGEFDGQKLTRPPKGFPADHPAMDLLVCRQWGVAATLPAETATQPTLVREIVERFRLAAPVVQLLNAPLMARPRQPLF